MPVLLTQDGNGNFHFSVDFTTADTLCAAVCATISQGDPIFSDDQRISAEVDGDGTPQFIDGIHTFQVQVASLDPNFQLQSADGRVGENAAAPEPSGGLLAFTGLAFVATGWKRRQRSARD